MTSPPLSPMASRVETGTTAVLLLLACMVGLRNAVFFFPRAVDDLFISLRYAENLATGAGLVYNAGEWVEGYSSLLWALLQAAGIAAGMDGVTATKVLALAATSVLFAGLWALGRELFGLSRPWAAAAMVLLASNSYVLSWCMYGLETPLHLALFTWFAVLVRRVSDGDGGRGAQIALGLTGVAFALTRPETPLWMAVLGPGAAGIPRSTDDLRVRLGRLLPPAGAVVVGWGLWLALRRSVYGLWVPHTYYAKQGSGLDASNLEPLWTQGAPWQEQLWWPLAALAALVSIRLTGRLFAPLVLATGLFFIAKVEMDWMPNMRHFLPLWLVSSLAVVGLARFGAQHLRVGPPALRVVAGMAFVASGVLAASMVPWLASVDSRFSPYDHATHGRGETWIRPKTTHEWTSTLALLRRRDPPGYEHADPDRLGLIQQTFVAIEASSRPEAESWFLGRDIGMIGYYSPIRIWETDGLFTPGAIRWTEGRDREPIEDGAIEEAMAFSPVAGEIYFEWMEALGRNPHLLEGYDVTIGSRRRPFRFEQSREPRPDARELEARYARVLAKLPTRFHFSELYGNPASPAIELRARVAVERARLREDIREPADPANASAGHLLDRVVQLEGCTLEPARVHPGDRSLLTCRFRRAARITRNYRVFVHADAQGRRVIHADHAIAQGAVTLRDEDTSTRVVSRAWLAVPADAPIGPLPVLVGLYDGDHRARVTPSEGTDGQNRVEAGVLEVVAKP